MVWRTKIYGLTIIFLYACHIAAKFYGLVGNYFECKICESVCKYFDPKFFLKNYC